jgi:hypothetical protein
LVSDIKGGTQTEGDEVEEDETGRACSKNEKEYECIYDIGGKAKRKETTRKTKT